MSLTLSLQGPPLVQLQAAALCLTRLTLLQLPGHMPISSMPVAPAGASRHLCGLTLLGGSEERSGGRRA